MRLTERVALREDAVTLLGELDDTVSEVAMSLCSLGVQVLSSSAGGSPAARYLHAVVGGDDRVKRVKVTRRWLVLKTRQRWWSKRLSPEAGARSQMSRNQRSRHTRDG